ncbi:Rz1-like lysis system protein LysC [Achromobacter insolitus]|uniref:Rz1-like lysis system protein LysC n=1 Tax=Achromobacter insolitus TaxID=217204 RepID=UPI0028AF38E7|nr:Rz1-like lysis system protein LysC [Achromobacter insolitus]
MALQGCASVPPSSEVRITTNTCPVVTPCSLPAEAPRTNGDLNLAYERLEAAWRMCAAKVDAIVKCQEEKEDAKGARAAGVSDAGSPAL